MVRVRTVARIAWIVALASAACRRPPSPLPPDAAPPPAASLSAPAPTTSSAAPFDAGVVAASDAGADAGSPALAPEYSKEGIAPLAPTCRDAQAILGVVPYGYHTDSGGRRDFVLDRSFIAQIKQAILAHPGFEVVAGKPTRPEQIKLTEADYGPKNFSIASAPNNYAVIAECAGPDACLDLAAMVRAVVPRAKPLLVCGEPPRITGGKEPIRGPWKMPDALPNPRDRAEVCARVTACSVRVEPTSRDAVARTCWKAPVKDAGRCASMLDCAEVARCFQGLTAP